MIDNYPLKVSKRVQDNPRMLDFVPFTLELLGA
jgi:hypothetical protein